MKNYQEEIGEEGFIEESEDQRLYGNYLLYVELTNINYTEEQIVVQLNCSMEELQKLKTTFE